MTRYQVKAKTMDELLGELASKPVAAGAEARDEELLSLIRWLGFAGGFLEWARRHPEEAVRHVEEAVRDSPARDRIVGEFKRLLGVP